MKATVVDMRYRMKEVLQALDRRETVDILYHGKLKGTIFPPHSRSKRPMREHPFFGMHKGDTRPVEDIMEELRGGRYRNLRH